MKNFKYIIITVLFLLPFSLWSQGHNNHGHNNKKCKQHREQINSEKVAFITNALSLSVKEAQQFWPVYNDYNDKIGELRDKKHSQMSAIRSKSKKESLSETEYQAFLDKYIFFIEEEAKLKKEYQKDLSKIFSAKKIFTLYRAQKDFKRKLVKDLRHKKPACLE